jgi:hypothetical protein
MLNPLAPTSTQKRESEAGSALERRQLSTIFACIGTACDAVTLNLGPSKGNEIASEVGVQPAAGSGARASALLPAAGPSTETTLSVRTVPSGNASHTSPYRTPADSPLALTCAVNCVEPATGTVPDAGLTLSHVPPSCVLTTDVNACG